MRCVVPFGLAVLVLLGTAAGVAPEVAAAGTTPGESDTGGGGALAGEHAGPDAPSANLSRFDVDDSGRIEFGEVLTAIEAFNRICGIDSENCVTFEEVVAVIEAYGTNAPVTSECGGSVDTPEVDLPDDVVVEYYDDNCRVGFDEVTDAIAAFNADETIDGDPVTVEDVLAVIEAFNTPPEV